MSVMQRNSYGGTTTGQPMDFQTGPSPQDIQRQAIINGLAPAQAPASATSGAFNRGGQTKQLPGSGLGGAVGNIGASAGVQVAGNILAKQAANQAASGLGGSAGGMAARAGMGGAAGAASGLGIGLGTSLLADKLATKSEMPTFGGEFGNITDEYGRRFQGTGGGINSNAIRYAGMVANPALTASTMGLNLAAGAAFGAIKGAVTKHAPSAFSDFKVEDAADAIQKAYQQYLGRPASEDEIQTHLVNQGWNPTGGDRWVGEKNLTGPQGVLAAIKNSPEAQAYANGGAQRQAVVDQLAPGSTGPQSASAAPSTPGTPYQNPAPGDVGPTVTFADGSTMPLTNAQNEATLAAQPANTLHWTGTPNTAPGGTGPIASAPAHETPPSVYRPEDGTSLTRLPGTVADGINEDGSGGITGRGAQMPVPAGDPGAATPTGASIPANADTDGYAAPQFTAAGSAQAPPGWDQSKWADTAHQTPKYAVGHILSQFPPTVDGLKQAAEQVAKAYPGTTFDGKDKLTIPGVGTIDVLVGAGKGGESWAWQPAGEGAGSAKTGAGPVRVDGSQGYGQTPDVLDANTIQQLKQRLQEIINGQPNREAIVNGLGASNG